MLAPILFLCLESSNISKGQFQKEAYHLLFPFPFATTFCKIYYALRRELHRTKDFVVQWISLDSRLSRIGCCRAMDVITQWISSRNGFHRVVDVVVHRILSRSGFHRVVDVLVYRMFLYNGFHHAVDFVS
jgi:hypothetical protein